MPDLYQSPSQLVKSNNESKLSNSEYENMGDLIKWASPTYCKTLGKPSSINSADSNIVQTAFKKCINDCRDEIQQNHA